MLLCCPKCADHPAVLLGRLGKAVHFRCRACGWEFAMEED